jgi:hypothetical protein
MWSALGGDPRFTADISITGERKLTWPFPSSDLASAAFGVVGAAVSELVEASCETAHEVRIDRKIRTGWFLLPSGPSQVLGVPKQLHDPCRLPPSLPSCPRRTTVG